MSSNVFPTLAGLSWDIEKTPRWRNTRQSAYSGAETAIAYWSYPQWSWSLTFNVLRQGKFGMPQTAYYEFSQLAGFYNQLYGDYDSFLYTDPDNHTATDQLIGIGDGTTLEFQMVNAYGNFVEPVFAPNVVSEVTVNGVPQTEGVDYTVSVWGSDTPGIITFTSPPGDGYDINATFTFYYPCRFDPGYAMTFKQFLSGLFSTEGVTFSSIKLGA